MKKGIFLTLTLLILSGMLVNAQNRLELTIENLPKEVIVGEIFTLHLNINAEAKYEIKEVKVLQPSGMPLLLEVISMDGLEVVVKAIGEGIQAINFTVYAAYFFPEDVVPGRIIGLTTNTMPISIVPEGTTPIELTLENLPEKVQLGDRFTLNLKINTEAKFEILEVKPLNILGVTSMIRVLAINGLEILAEAVREGDQIINFSVKAAYYFPDEESRKRVINLTTNSESVSILPTDLLCGDANSDGSVNVLDGLLIAQYYVGLIQTFRLSPGADVNSDSIINILDALLVIQYYVGYDTKLNCQGN